MFAHNRIKLLDQHFFRFCFFIFVGSVKMTGTGSTFEFNFFTHFGLPLNDRLDGARCAQIREHSVNATLFKRTHTSSGNAQRDPAIFRFNPNPSILQIGQKTALGFIVSVGNIVAHHRAFTRYFTYACHDDIPNKSNRGLLLKN
jgi:hypothetical protein